jgi:hypothetical protein
MKFRPELPDVFGFFVIILYAVFIVKLFCG